MVTLVGAFATAFWVTGDLLNRSLNPFADYVWLLWIIVPAWTVALRAFGLYDSSAYESLWGIVGRVVKAQALAALMLLSTMYLTKSAIISRLLLQTFIGVSFVALTIQKLVVWTTLERLRRRRGAQVTKVLLVCDPSHADAYLRVLSEHVSWHSEVVGILMPETANVGELRLAEAKSMIGHIMDLPRVLLTHVVDEVVMVQPLGRTETERVSEWCAERGLSLRIMVQLPKPQSGNYSAYDLGNSVCLLSLETGPQHALRLFLKRALDVAGAVIGLILFFLVYLWYGRKLRREAAASPLFAQTRVGRNGRRFTLYKLRTMHDDAEQRLKELLKHNQMRGHMFKLKDDPRITPTGKQLRERHLDELPQFWNVLKGEMSLVGTRPPTTLEVEHYNSHHHRRLSIKPGITGLWQVKGNDEINDFEEVVKLDCEYIDNWSLWLDLKILARTVAKMTARGGW